MREKDHSPRKMLPSPKQGCIYPMLSGTNVSLGVQIPFDLSTSSRSTTVSLLHALNNDQPLDLRVERKKSSGSHHFEDENRNLILSDESDVDASPPTKFINSKTINNNDLSSSNNNNNNNNHISINHNLINENSLDESKKSFLNIKENLRTSSSSASSHLASSPVPNLFPAPSLHPLMLEAMAKAARLPFSYRLPYLRHPIVTQRIWIYCV